MNKSKVLADVALGLRSHVVAMRKGFDVVQGLDKFAANSPEDKTDDPEP